MEMRKCRVCGELKSLDEYAVRNKERGWHSGTCKQCTRKYYREYRKSHIEAIRESARKYVKKHKEKHTEYNRKWNLENKERKDEWRREKMNDKEYRDKFNEYRRERYHKIMADTTAREKRNTYTRELERKKRLDPEYRKLKTDQSIKRRKERIISDPVFKLSIRIRNLIRTSLLNHGYTKKSKTYEIVGCDYETLWQHLKQSWLDNYGQEWNGEPYHIDHIIPLATAKTEQELIKLCHYTNLQLLTPFDNMSKHDKITMPLK